MEPYLKSEDVPETQGNVKVAVAKNFDDLIFNSGKDALIVFYAPWCGRCKKIIPNYDELGNKMAEEDVVIAKMDATANDVPDGFDVQVRFQKPSFYQRAALQWLIQAQSEKGRVG